MASAWGESWAQTWGDSWGGVTPPVPPKKPSMGGYWPHDIKIREEEEEEVVEIKPLMADHAAVIVDNVPFVGKAAVLIRKPKKYQMPLKARLNRAVAAQRRNEEDAMFVAMMIFD